MRVFLGLIFLAGCASAPPKGYETCVVSGMARLPGVGLPRYLATCANAEGTSGNEVIFSQPVAPGTTIYFVPYKIEGEEGTFGSPKGG